MKCPSGTRWDGKLARTFGKARHMALVKMLTEARENAGMTQTELAEKLGEYQSFVARLESGQRRVDVVELIELAEVLGFDAPKAVKALQLVDDKGS